MIPHWITDGTAVLTPFIIVAWLMVKLKTKDAIHQATETIVAKVSEVGTALAVHVGSDEQKHLALDGRIDQHEKRLDRVEQKA